MMFKARRNVYRIVVENPLGVCRGVKHLEVDGVDHTGSDIPLSDDRREHSYGSFSASDGRSGGLGDLRELRDPDVGHGEIERLAEGIIRRGIPTGTPRDTNGARLGAYTATAIPSSGVFIHKCAVNFGG